MDSNKVYLSQTDTTVGFLSSDDKKLSLIKKRDHKQKILQVVDSFKTLNSKLRVPKKFRKVVRKSSLTTFIYPNSLAFRLIDKCSEHHNFIKKHKVLYSTSANLTKQNFDEKFAIAKSDIVIYGSRGFKEAKSSKIYKIDKNNIHRIR